VQISVNDPEDAFTMVEPHIGNKLAGMKLNYGETLGILLRFFHKEQYFARGKTSIHRTRTVADIHERQGRGLRQITSTDCPLGLTQIDVPSAIPRSHLASLTFYFDAPVVKQEAAPADQQNVQ